MCRLANSVPGGAFAEVGVYHGGSAWFLAQIAKDRGNALHLFDTWAGIPCKAPIDIHAPGDFADVVLSEVREKLPDAVFHVGVFPQTMPGDLDELAFVHADCDQYESVKSCIDVLYPKLVTGGIMLFDDYGALDGATLAVEEAFGDDRLFLTDEGKAYVVKS